MPITGLSFLLFALAAVMLYYLFPKRLRQYVLLAASILQYPSRSHPPIPAEASGAHTAAEP